MFAHVTDAIELALLIYGKSRFIGAPAYGVSSGELVLGARSGSRHKTNPTLEAAMEMLFERYETIRSKHGLDIPAPLKHFSDYPIDHYTVKAEIMGVVSKVLVADLTPVEADGLFFRRKPVLMRMIDVQVLSAPTRITTTSGMYVPYNMEEGVTEPRRKMIQRHIDILFDFCDMLERLQKTGVVDQDMIKAHRGFRYLENMTARELQGIIVKKHNGARIVLRVTGKWKERFLKRFGDPSEV